METHPLDGFEELEEHYAQELPEDVAILYSWANLESATYKDFSSNRREQRAQMRQRAAEQMQLAALRAHAEIEAITAQAEMDAAAADAIEKRVAERISRQGSGRTSLSEYQSVDLNVLRELSGGQDEQLKHDSPETLFQEPERAPIERGETAKRQEVLVVPEAMARRAEQEATDARVAAIRQAARHAEAGLRGRLATSLDSDMHVPGGLIDPYPARSEDAVDPLGLEMGGASPTNDGELDANTVSETPDTGSRKRVAVGFPESTKTADLAFSSAEARVEVVNHIPLEENTMASQSSHVLQEISLFEVAPHAMSELFEAEPVCKEENAVADGDPAERSNTDVPVSAETMLNISEERPTAVSKAAGHAPGPEWLYPGQQAAAMHGSPASSAGAFDRRESLEQSKGRIAARWFALRRIFGHHDDDLLNQATVPGTERGRTPVVAVFSVAGGAGKSSLVATLGRALSHYGERVLLSETSTYGMLPFYFGAGPRASGVVRVFAPPPGNADAPIRLVSYNAMRQCGEAGEEASIVEDMHENSQRVNRVLIDLSVNCAKMMGKLGERVPTILVPLMPDMNSVISIDAIERLCRSIGDADGSALRPVYLLNQFDASLPLHLDIREVLKQQLCERLLPFVVRRSPAVGEALAEGMTIVDYDPGSAVAEDYLRVANWLRSVSAPAAVGFRNLRWSEQ